MPCEQDHMDYLLEIYLYKALVYMENIYIGFKHTICQGKTNSKQPLNGN